MREACNYIAEYIGDRGVFYDSNKAPEGTVETYDTVLTQIVGEFFQEIERDFFKKKFEELVNQIIFDAGMEICQERYPATGDGDMFGVVRTDKFDPEKAESAIQRRTDYIRSLASQI